MSEEPVSRRVLATAATRKRPCRAIPEFGLMMRQHMRSPCHPMAWAHTIRSVWRGTMEHSPFQGNIRHITGSENVMESNSGPETGSNRRRVSVVQLICRAYGLSDASEITMEHIHRYVAERRRAEERMHHLRDRFRPGIPRPRASGDAA
ncbi:hypothetical protein [Streptomyces decoyicus]|uniref:hypothetical protein n=2 Tax=Streptomyces decoyicus TaxID=249567 RepID=UPI0033A5994F